MKRDPICGMTVNPATALHAERDGETHFFCGDDCLQQFLNASAASQRAGPCVIVIFGASGDLTKRKLLPALCNLVAGGLLSEDFAIIGVGRTEWSDNDFRQQMREAIAEFATQKMDPALWTNIEQRLRYCSGSYTDPETYQRLSTMLEESNAKQHTSGNALFYLSVPPISFAPIAQQLHASGLLKEVPPVWRRLVIEKPFGHDLASARELNATLSASLAESQIFRIDHYLGKETAQNLLVFRLGNSMIEPVWNRTFIDHVEITAAESIGIEGRAAFYETAGAFRDMMQTHMLMLLALITMEPPASLSGEAVRNEKAKLLEAIRIPKPEDVMRDTVRGQYGPGEIAGKPIDGYAEEPGVSLGSTVETFAAAKLWIDNWRWAGVPFYLRTGKRLARRVTEIVVHFKSPPLSLFGGTECSPLGPNLLIMHIQPEEGITLQMRAKTPGPTIHTQAVTLDFDYSQFGKTPPTTGYEKLLYDAITGDGTLFHRSDMVEAAWKIADPILSTWASNPRKHLPIYAPGTWGPSNADQLLADDGQWWTA
ncbi:MAG: glucose-6-phosphate dehydrogenase [Prosthecobacter sp.]